MADPGFPGQHSTTTTVKSSSTAVDTTIRFDPSYIRTIPGYLKIAEIVSIYIVIKVIFWNLQLLF